MKFFSGFFAVEALDISLLPDPKKIAQNKIKVQKHARWKTPEFIFYYVLFVLAVPIMFRAARKATTDGSPQFSEINYFLNTSWLDRRMDNSDLQYRGFRNHLPILAAVLTAHLTLRKIANYFNIKRITFDLFFGILFVLSVHVVNSFKVFLLLYLNYYLCHRFSIATAKKVVWVFAVFILISNQYYRGYNFTSLIPPLSWLDKQPYCGIMRWEIHFNFAILRMISYDFDFFKSKEDKISTEKKRKEGDFPLNERERVEVSGSPEDYKFINYFAYCLYTPLYTAGPIITFNDYVYQSKYSSGIKSWSWLIRYTLRFLFCLMIMEFLIHYMYIVAATRVSAWKTSTTFQICMMSYFNLHLIWLKLLIPWRFFRLWGLLDGIESPENMIRCMSDNYSVMSFWRGWHRSYNKWVVRYVYIPLGGSKHPVLNTLVVFTFVSIWHDIQLRLLLWGWLVTLFILPEILATKLFPESKWGDSPYFRFICGIGAVINIVMMMLANMVGFVVGPDGLKEIIKGIFGTAEGLKLSFVYFICLFVASQIMFELRESEKRRGVNLRY